MSTFVDLVKWAIRTKSWWALIGALVVGAVSALVWGLFVFKSRKLAKLEHAKAVREEELTQKKEDVQKSRHVVKRKELEMETKELQKEIDKLDAEIKKVDDRLLDTIGRIKGAKTWDDLHKSSPS